jgi:hypothetical protein
MSGSPDAPPFPRDALRKSAEAFQASACGRQNASFALREPLLTRTECFATPPATAVAAPSGAPRPRATADGLKATHPAPVDPLAALQAAADALRDRTDALPIGGDDANSPCPSFAPREGVA